MAGVVMRKALLLIALGSFTVLASSCNSTERAPADAPAASSQQLLDELVALERSALDRWIRLDPDGYLDLYAQGVTYFDPQREKRIDGLAAMQNMLAPIRGMTAPFTEPRYELIDPKVQAFGDAALLTFNVVSYGKIGDRPEGVLARWNASELYARVEGSWKIVHSHWSYVKPKVTPPAL
jgi:ketosteroid isomerase-like protein